MEEMEVWNSLNAVIDELHELKEENAKRIEELEAKIKYLESGEYVREQIKSMIA